MSSTSKVLMIAKPTADQFTHGYTKFLECDKLITNDINEVLAYDIDRYDVVWLEWANDFTSEITHFKWKCKIVVRVHDHEIYRGRVDNVNWSNVDYIWFINRDAQIDFNERIKCECNQFFLPNAVDLDSFKVSEFKNKHIAHVSIFMKERKRIDRAIEIYRELIKHDSDWKMTIRAEPTGAEDMKMIRTTNDLKGLFWDLRSIDETKYGNDKSDLNKFYRDKAIILSTSNHEGFHYSIAEGAMCGCMPVVYDWEWGRAKDFWSPFVCKNTGDMVYEILNWTSGHELNYRGYVQENFSGNNLAPKLLAYVNG